MLNLDVISIYILTIALLALVFGVFINSRQKNGKSFSLWLASTFVGLLLGATGALAACYWMGYEVVEKLELPDLQGVTLDDIDEEASMTPGGGGGGSRTGSRGESGGGARRGSGRQMPARYQLMTLVRKLELLTGDVAIELSDEQAEQVYALLKEVEAADSMSDEDAQEKHDALLAVMEDNQQAKTEAVSIPFRRGSSGSSRGGSRGSRGNSDGGGTRGASGSGGTNLFREGSGADAIQALLLRLARQEGAENE